MDPRTEAAAVREYLDLLTAPKPRAVGRRNKGWLAQRIDWINNKLAEEDSDLNAVQRVELIQERLDCERDLAQLTDTSALDQAEQNFIEVGKAWADRKGISAEALRELGVPPRVLRAAGFKRVRRAVDNGAA